MDGLTASGRLRDANKPYIRLAVRVVLGLLLIGLIAICWANGGRTNVDESVLGVAIIGAVYGALVACSDIAVGVDDQAFIVRNQLMVTRVPMRLVERVDSRFGAYLRIRDRRLAVRVSAASGLLLGRGAGGPRAVAEELQGYVDAAKASTASSGERVQMRLKSTWFVAVPAAIVLSIGVDLISRAAH